MNIEEENFKEAQKQCQEYVNTLSMNDILDPKRRDGENFEMYKFRQDFAKRWIKYRLRDKDFPSWYHPIDQSKTEEIPLLSKFLKDNEGI
jgi:hypothetical protein